jgi:hypothetical protein
MKDAPSIVQRSKYVLQTLSVIVQLHERAALVARRVPGFRYSEQIAEDLRGFGERPSVDAEELAIAFQDDVAVVEPDV